MKKILLIVAAIAVLAGCKKPEAPIILPEDVQITISYSLDTSVGSDMTKSSDAELWEKFYKKMKMGEMVAESYKLIFTELTSGAKYEFEGSWADQDIVTIKTGKYTVTGTSTSEQDNYIQKRASLIFDTEVTISASQTSITLPALYDCFLIAFAKSNITHLSNHVSYDSNMGGVSGETLTFFTFDDHYYAFSRKLYNTKYAKECYIKGKREDGSSFTIYTADLAFEKGKYYFYTDASSLYSLPEMQPGE